ncbi:hypothetical protein BDD12DRAFT_854646 [Trichophaea hybrida]|nr:hypothetical protein BDD12DRAFT_854646 [Trichophaea hybrida]
MDNIFHCVRVSFFTCPPVITTPSSKNPKHNSKPATVSPTPRCCTLAPTLFSRPLPSIPFLGTTQYLLDQQSAFINEQKAVIDKSMLQMEAMDLLLQQQRKTIRLLTKELPPVPVDEALDRIAEEIVDWYDSLPVSSLYDMPVASLLCEDVEQPEERVVEVENGMGSFRSRRCGLRLELAAPESPVIPITMGELTPPISQVPMRVP